MVMQKKEKALAKTPENSPKKRNLDQNINDSKPQIWTSFLKNINFWAYNFIKKVLREA